jgi:hypothetical protein
MPKPPLSVPELFALMARHGAPAELARIMVAAALAESEGVPDLVGDHGHSLGLFQIHDRGRGASLPPDQLPRRADPDFAIELMRPFFETGLREGRQQGLAEESLAIYVYLEAERPEGYPDPHSPAAGRYRTRWRGLEAEPAGDVTNGFRVGPQLRAFLEAHPEWGLARDDEQPLLFQGREAGLYLWTTPTPEHRNGGILIYRRWRDEVRGMGWE